MYFLPSLDPRPPPALSLQYTQGRPAKLHHVLHIHDNRWTNGGQCLIPVASGRNGRKEGAVSKLLQHNWLADYNGRCLEYHLSNADPIPFPRLTVLAGIKGKI